MIPKVLFDFLLLFYLRILEKSALTLSLFKSYAVVLIPSLLIRFISRSLNDCEKLLKHKISNNIISVSFFHF